MPSGSMWSKDNHLNEFKEYTYENICFYLTITWYVVSFKTKYLKSLSLFIFRQKRQNPHLFLPWKFRRCPC